ncbi:hypothetical protein PPL_02722 [Heterostelium album PN500]|uniref:Uncharacterized protein n=1 Tax=Heterostelium pallidum (strain ATCC 26659 / Pp 5 / PN500) TaxID=670386 RepID=D3B2V8_HETP5|nr:hypothetical protein PPL_02722 [Heterostelium album PN500]EFA83656.1 hypothetical protein PPL_02722 [Heterostelium album PN500]|eukprot:XP_020435773.1 hypothetical protein PPL_02722 [Heterostelium album PN500]
MRILLITLLFILGVSVCRAQYPYQGIYDITRDFQGIDANNNYSKYLDQYRIQVLLAVFNRWMEIQAEIQSIEFEKRKYQQYLIMTLIQNGGLSLRAPTYPPYPSDPYKYWGTHIFVYKQLLPFLSKIQSQAPNFQTSPAFLENGLSNLLNQWNPDRQ